jgi:hypothetical protein
MPSDDKSSHCLWQGELKSLYYLNKWVLKMNNYSFLSECFDFSFTSTEKTLVPKNFVGPLEFKSQ